MHKKGITEEVAKKRSRKNVKVQVCLLLFSNQRTRRVGASSWEGHSGRGSIAEGGVGEH